MHVIFGNKKCAIEIRVVNHYGLGIGGSLGGVDDTEGDFDIVERRSLELLVRLGADDLSAYNPLEANVIDAVGLAVKHDFLSLRAAEAMFGFLDDGCKLRNLDGYVDVLGHIFSVFVKSLEGQAMGSFFFGLEYIVELLGDTLTLANPLDLIVLAAIDNASENDGILILKGG